MFLKNGKKRSLLNVISLVVMCIGSTVLVASVMSLIGSLHSHGNAGDRAIPLGIVGAVFLGLGLLFWVLDLIKEVSLKDFLAMFHNTIFGDDCPRQK